MKKILVFIVFLLGITILQAKWATITLKEHIKASSLILIAQFEKEIEKKETDIGEIQLVSFKPIESIKGDINSSFVVQGEALYMCVPQMMFPVTLEEKYLLFVNKGDDGSYHLTHGERSGLLIVDGEVDWVKDNAKIDLGTVRMNIEMVKREIKGLL